MLTANNDYEQRIFDLAIDSTFARHFDVTPIYLTELRLISEDAYHECADACLDIFLQEFAPTDIY